VHVGEQAARGLMHGESRNALQVALVQHDFEGELVVRSHHVPCGELHFLLMFQLLCLEVHHVMNHPVEVILGEPVLEDGAMGEALVVLAFGARDVPAVTVLAVRMCAVMVNTAMRMHTVCMSAMRMRDV
jgi:hypothetical protein